MLPAESGTLPHRPWTPMSLVNGRSPQAKRCGRDGAKRKSVRKRLPLRWSRCVGDSPRKPLRHHREAATARDGAKHHREAGPKRKARHHRGVTAGRETARLHREATPQRKARHHREATAATEGAMQHRGSNLPNQHHRDVQPAEPAPSGEQPAEPAPSGSGCFGK